MIEKIIEIVKNAGKLMLEKSFEIRQKDGYENIVTSVDIQVQQYLISHLKKFVTDASFLCEENTKSDAINAHIAGLSFPSMEQQILRAILNNRRFQLH